MCLSSFASARFCVCDPGKGSLPSSTVQIQFHLRMLMAFRHFTNYLRNFFYVVRYLCVSVWLLMVSMETKRGKGSYNKKFNFLKVTNSDVEHLSVDSGNEIGNYPISSVGEMFQRWSQFIASGIFTTTIAVNTLTPIYNENCSALSKHEIFTH